MRKLRDEQGSALMMALLILFVALGLGIALMATAQSGQRSAANQQGSESAYALAEAALNAQVFELSVRWPTKQDSPSPTASTNNYGYAYGCNASSTASAASYCPTSADLSTAYPVSSQTCPAGTKGDGWNNSSTVSNGWTTYVRDAGPSTASSSQVFNSSFEETQPYYDATGSANPDAGGAVWVRSVGIVNCHTSVVVTKVADQIVGLNFPNYVLNANSFTISNSGQKDIINTEDTSKVTSSISLRCAGDGGLPPNSTCAGEQNSNQIQPTPTYSPNPAPTPTLPASHLALAKNMAIANGTYFAPGNCPTSETQLQGNPVYVDGTNAQPCIMKFQGNGTINSFDKTTGPGPGLLIIANGTLDLEGGETFYGVVYGANQGALGTPVVTLGGTATVVGGMAVDGSASLSLGSSGNGAVSCTDTSSQQKCGDLEYLSAAFNGLVGFAGADPVPNTFRQLPAGQ